MDCRAVAGWSTCVRSSRLLSCGRYRAAARGDIRHTLRNTSSSRTVIAVLTQTSEYALRIMAFLAQQPADALVPAIAMEGKVRVPANYRGKILNLLTRAGLLTSTRGRAGGFRLARPASRIRLSDVVAPFEAVTGPRTCILGRTRCQESHPCGAHDRWRLLGQARERFLRDTTVADVAA